MTLPEAGIDTLLGAQARAIPIAGQHAFTGEESADFRGVDRLALVMIVAHDVEERFERRTSPRDTAVGEVMLRHAFLRDDNVLHPLGKVVHPLQFGFEHFIGEHDMRMIKDPAEERVDELLRDPAAETAGQDRAAFVLEVFQALEITVRVEELRRPLLDAHTAPDLGNEKTDVMVDPGLRTDITRRGDEALVAADRVGHECGIQIVNRRQGVEGAFGQRTFRTRARGRWRLARHAADELHEKFRQLHVVDRVVNSERTDPRRFIRRIVAAAGEDGIDRREHGRVTGQAASQPDPHIGQVAALWIQQVRPRLQVARILGRTPVDQTRIGVGNKEVRAPLLHIARDHFLHRPGVFVVADRVLEDAAGLGHGERLVVREKVPPVGKVVLRDFVIAAMNGIVGPLEKAVFAIVDKFDRRQVPGLRVEQAGDERSRDHGGRRDIVLHLDLGRREEVLAQPEGAPCIVRIETDTQEIGHQLAAVKPQFVGRETVDRVDAEILPPVLAPLRAVEPLEHVDQLLDVLRDGLEPGIVVRTEGGRRGEQLDHRAQRAVGT